MQVALASSLIFRIVDAEAEDSTGDTAFYGKNGVAWVLRFGGVCTMVSFFFVLPARRDDAEASKLGAMVARMVPPTRNEKDMRRRLAELKALREEGTA